MTTNLRNLTESNVDWNLAKEIFADLVEAPFPDRAGMLNRKTGHDERLQQVVKRLLASHDAADSFLDETDSPDPGDPK